jgi:hypothetical protein
MLIIGLLFVYDNDSDLLDTNCGLDDDDDVDKFTNVFTGKTHVNLSENMVAGTLYCITQKIPVSKTMVIYHVSHTVFGVRFASSVYHCITQKIPLW